ncbi:PHP domain-containing protein, partial [Candidatus Fermentibacteria bacterium]|nr:PHP domain-containing protein [Candidatus Fermentibacteria bacterium]
MRIMNPGPEDFHVHSLCFSDGINTVDEIVHYAARCGLERIAITDHSQAYLDSRGFAKKTTRSAVARWRNVHNHVEVVFGVEGDILNRAGDICDHIQGRSGELLILSAHEKPFADDPACITEAYLNAI